jgi:L-ascorbate metabolism protein UlaG (beta-lactamase superfamily)
MKLILLFITLILSTDGRSKDYVKSDHYDGEKFYNPNGPSVRSFWSFLKWQFTKDTKEWPEKLPIKNYPLRELSPDDKGSATFINHATFLIQLQKLNILTDPVYSERVSPVSFIGPSRVREPGIPFELLPSIDVVLISHNHYDHLDLETLKKIDGKFHPLFLVPLGDEKILKEAGILNVQELDWWQEIKVQDTHFTFAPAAHWSGRGLFDKNDSLWGSFMISNPLTKIYFAGDSGYGDHFRNIKSRLGAPELALLPIGAYSPAWFMARNHINPEEAILAHRDLGAQRSVAMHFGTFQLSDEGVHEPVVLLNENKKKLGINDKTFMILEHGQTISY